MTTTLRLFNGNAWQPPDVRDEFCSILRVSNRRPETATDSCSLNPSRSSMLISCKGDRSLGFHNGVPAVAARDNPVS